MKKDQIEELYRKRLAQYEPDLPIPSWEQIQDRISPVASRRIPMWRIAVAAMLILGFTGWLGTFFLPSEQSGLKQPTLTSNISSEMVAPVAEKYSIPSEPVSMLGDDVAKKIESTKFSTHSSRINQITDSETLTGKSGSNQHNDLQSVTGVRGENKLNADISHKGDQNTRNNQNIPIKKSGSDFSPTIKNQSGIRGRSKRGSGFALGLLASNSSGNTSSDRAMVRNYADRPLNQVQDFNGKLQSSLDRNSLSSFNHRMPLRFGLTASYAFNKRFSIESGLLYTYHYSSFDRLDGMAVQGVQKLHYMGVPLNLICEVFDYSNFRLYAGVGGELNFNIGAKQTYTYSDQKVKYSFHDHNVVWGYGAKVGIAYRLIKHLELYLEPSLQHFASKTDLRIKWTDSPIIFDLNLGLRSCF